MPTIAPPDTPFFSEGSAKVGVLVALGDIVAETLESEDAESETGREVVGVAVAWSCAREMGKEDADGLAELSKEKVSLSFVSERFATGLSIVLQHTLTWSFVAVHSSLV